MGRTLQVVVREHGYIADILTVVYLGDHSRVCIGPHYTYEASIEFRSPRHDEPNLRMKLVEAAIAAVNGKDSP